MTRSDTSNPTTESNAPRFVQTGKMISNFCRRIRSPELGRLKLSVSRSALFDEGIELLPKGNGISLQAPSVPLEKVLASGSLDKDGQRKLLLSYLLAKAVWQFYESDWMAEDWNKRTVQFMRQRQEKLQKGASLNHRPFISTELRTSAPGLHPHQGDPSQENEATTEAPRQSHIFPKVLALGIMLLEIELGKGIEKLHPSEFIDANGQPRENAGHITAGEFIISKEWKSRTKTYKPLKQVIEICVKPDTTKLGSDPTRVRDNLYRWVVGPLENFFNMVYDCPDECPAKFDPGPMNFESSDGLCDATFRLDSVGMQDVTQAPSQLAENSSFNCAVTDEPHQIQDRDSEPEITNMDLEDCELFGDERVAPPNDQ